MARAEKELDSADQVTPPERRSLRRLADPQTIIGLILAVLALAAFVTLWWSVIIGRDVLLGGDLLVGCCYPWAGEPGRHFIQNGLVGDAITQVLPWQEVVSAAWRQGQLPLWNPYALSGSPLLANDESAPFSPFTWLAMPFQAAHGISLAMLTKLLVAGTGMALYLRRLGARAPAQVAGAIAFGSSSFLVVWLGLPHAAVAALIPWVFAAVEWYLKSGRVLAWASVAAAVCLQFLAGQVEVSFFLCVAISMYVLIRWAFGNRSAIRLIGVVTAGVVGTSMAAIQLLPFVDDLATTTIGYARAASHIGGAHLPLSEAFTWLVPNGLGNPAVATSTGPNYNETTGFAGVAMLVLMVPGIWWQWKRDKGPAIALVAIGAFAAGTAYGLFTPVVGLLPLFDSMPNWRLWVLLTFVVPVFGALGIDAIASGELRRRLPLPVGILFAAIGGLGVLGVIAGGTVFLRRHAAVITMLRPLPYHFETFWVLLAAAALVGAAGFLAAGAFGGLRYVAVVGILVLVLTEASIFAGPYQPRVPATMVPPPNPLISWLQVHAGDRPVAAMGNILPPETSTLYGIHDVRGYDDLISYRTTLFWGSADPAFSGLAVNIVLQRPRAKWLAAAGVVYFLAPHLEKVPGTVLVRDIDGIDIDAVKGASPFATASPAWDTASSPTGAAHRLSAINLSKPVLEGAPVSTLRKPGHASVTVTERTPDKVTLRAASASRVAVMVRQSYASGWRATDNGRPTRIYPADVAFQGVIVGPGVHVLDFVYEPDSVVWGGRLSLAGLAAWLLIAILAAGWRASWRKQLRWPRLSSVRERTTDWAGLFTKITDRTKGFRRP